MPERPLIKENTLVPLDIIAEITAKKRTTMLRVYLYINARSRGAIYITRSFRQQVADALGITERHVRTCINWLKKDFGWIATLTPGTDHCLVRGFRKILERRGEDASFQCSVLDNASGLLEDKDRFEAWLWASHIGGTARRKRHIYFRRLKIKEPRDKGEELLYGSHAKRDSKPSQHSRSSFYWPMAALYIKKSLGCSISTAADGRAAAEAYGFIEIKRYRRELTQAEIEKAAIDDPDLLKRLRRQRGRVLVDGIHGIREGEGLVFKAMSTRKKKRLSQARIDSMADAKSGYMDFLGHLDSSLLNSEPLALKKDDSVPF